MTLAADLSETAVMNLRRHFAWNLGLIVGGDLLVFWGCAEPNTDPCANNECTETGGDGEGDGDGDGDGDGGGDGEGNGDGDGDGDMPCTGSEDCTAADAPFCDIGSGMCVDCDGTAEPDGACAGADVTSPLCLDGVCVTCTADNDDACMGVTPICDVGTNTCVACGSHEECPESACNLAAGNCIDPAAVLHVDKDNLNCMTADGSEAAPYCDIAVALGNAMPECLIIVHEQDLNVSYQEAIQIQTSAAIFAANGELPRLQGVSGDPALTIGMFGRLFARGLQISNSPVEGIRVNGQAWLENVDVVSNDGRGVTVTGNEAQAWIRASKISNNLLGGIMVTSGGLVLENSFVGGEQNNQRALYVISGTVDVNYSTLVAGALANASALFCDDGSNTTVRNSLIVAEKDPGDELTCSGATLSNNALEMDMGGNTALGPMDPMWFPGIAAGDFHLGGIYPMAIEMAAVWMTGDPTVDIDGEVRANTDGAADVAGADVP